jgi:hypothetical protein
MNKKLPDYVFHLLYVQPNLYFTDLHRETFSTSTCSFNIWIIENKF